MKFPKILFLTLVVLGGTSCTLDLLENPNVVKLGEQNPSLVLNSMQLALVDVFQTASTIGMQQTRLQNGAGTDYSNSVRPETFNGLWTNAYANILVEGNALIPSLEAQGYYRHAGIARVLMAYTLVLLVDFFGDVPYSEALQGLSNFNPAPDPGQEVYNAAIGLLETARDRDFVTPLTNATPTPGLQNPIAPAITDFFYGASTPTSSYANWIRLINSLLLKIHLNTGSVSGINAAITHSGGLIVAQNQNFIFRYSTNISAPDSRHPRFVANYPAGGGNYMSNWLIWHMFHGYDATQNGAPGDPRIRFYFYRQRLSNSTNDSEIRCVLSPAPPDHYPKSTGSAIIPNSAAGIPPLGEQPTHPTLDPTDPAWGRTFCYPTNVGYWGRDHQDNQGIPPDGLARTAWGAYPAGGRFDNNSGAQVNANVGMRGAGFQPIMMRSFVQFMLAEANLRLGAATPSIARVHFQNGISYSMQDVRDWAVNGTYGTTAVAAAPTEASTINSFYPSGNYSSDVTNYINAALDAFDNAPASRGGSMGYVAREYWIALFGNGVEAYNLYRRTGLPTGMQPAQNPVPGNFPWVFWYPANAANLNRNIDQRANLKERAPFWLTPNNNLDF